jgi:hypothetical protein
MKKPINKCKDKSFVKIPGVSGYLINKKGEIFSEFKGEVMKPALRSGYHFVVIMTDTGKRKTMRKREITATGMINNNGGLQMYMGELNQFFAMHRGSRIIARFTVASPGSSEALKGYYFNYVVPTFRHAIWEAGERLTEEQTERRLREFSPIMYDERVNEETGKYSHELRTVAELSNAELIEHIETLKEIAAEEYNTYIDDPRTL